MLLGLAEEEGKKCETRMTARSRHMKCSREGCLLEQNATCEFPKWKCPLFTCILQHCVASTVLVVTAKTFVPAFFQALDKTKTDK